MAEAAADSSGPRIQDAEAARIWNSLMDRIAPDDGYARTRYLQFDWIVSRGEGQTLRRSHRWAMWEGDYRVEAPVDGGTMVALFNVSAPDQGRVWVDGEQVTGARADSLLDRANGMFINDSYWLLMPFKWGDPGVTATYVGQETAPGWGDATYQVVELTFEGVGLTPQNKYRAYVDPGTGMMELWAHYREADQDEPNFVLAWTDWRDHGPIMLSSRREDPEGNAPIWFENLRAETEVPQGMFEPPEGDPGM
jgi:hypothetical protein